MHEMSIVEGLIAIISETAEKHRMTRIEKVNLRIGAMRQVVPDALQFAFEVLGEGTIAEGAKIHITEIPLRARCGSCGDEFTVEQYSFICPACGSSDVAVVEGKELYIESIEGD